MRRGCRAEKTFGWNGPTSVRFARMLINLLLVPFNVLEIAAQGTTKFIGFEEFAVGSTPPFVIQESIKEATPQVANIFAPFEGQKYLTASGEISLESPDGQLIQSFSLHFAAGGSYPPYIYYVAGQRIDTQQPGWQTVQGTFTSPVKSIPLSGHHQDEFLAASYSVDAVEFTTIPEPQTFWLLTIGAAISSRALKRPKPNHA
jgi:hypothetical protein